MYTRILVPLDGSRLAEEALPYAHWLAAGSHAWVELLQVLEPAPHQGASGHPAASGGDVPGLTQEGARIYLDRLAAAIRRTGIAVTGTIRNGEPAAAILAEAEREPGTYVAMSSHGRSGLGRWLLGSVTEKVLHATTSPLLIARAQEPQVYGEAATVSTFLVPLDGSAIAEQILPHIAVLATGRSLHVMLLRVLPGDHFRNSRAGSHAGPYEIAPVHPDARAAAYSQKIADGLRAHGTLTVDLCFAYGNAGAAIIGLAQDLPDSMIAMTTHGHSGLGRWLLGSVTERVVHEAKRPVLVVRAKAPVKGQS